MQGLFGICHTLTGPRVVAGDFQRGIDVMEPPDHYSATSVDTATGNAIFGRLGSSILAPTPAHFSNDKVLCLLEGEYLVQAPYERVESFVRSPERLARLYEREYTNLPRILAGAFVGLVYDIERQELHLFNDRFGHRPLYFHSDGQRLIFAPTTRMATALGNLETNLDLDAAAQFFRYQNLLENHALFQEFTLLGPACMLTFNLHSGSVAVNPYWHFNELPLEQNVPWDDAVEHGSFLMQRAIDRATSGNHRFGVYLSGGLDSRMILGGMGKNARGIPALNYGAESGGDVVYAKRVAKVAGADYKHIDPASADWTLEFIDFYGKYSYTPLHYFNGANGAIARQASQFIDINLSGVVGDCILTNPMDSWPLMEDVEDRWTLLEALDYYMAHGHFHPGTIDLERAPRAFVPEFAAQLGDRAREGLARVADTYDCDLKRVHDFFYLHTRARRCLGNLVHLERSSMETRAVFYDYDLVDYFMSLPYAHRLDRVLNIAVLNRVAPHLVRIPMMGSSVPPVENKRLVKAYYYKNHLQSWAHRKLKWVPPVPGVEISEWRKHTQEDTAKWIEEFVLSDDSRMAPLLNADYVRSWMNRLAAGSSPAAWVLGNFVTFEKLLRVG